MTKALIVDDSETDTEILKVMLGEDFEINTQENGLNTVAFAEANQPEFILLDMNMPDINGMTVLKNLKENRHTQHIPVIIITAKSDETDLIRQAYDLGAFDFVGKPFCHITLLSKINQAIRIKRTENSLKKSLNFNNRLLNSVRLIIIGVNNNDKICYWNEHAEVFFGIKKEDVLNKPILSAHLDWNWEKVSLEVVNCLSKKNYSNLFDVEYYSQSLGTRILSFGITPFSESDSDDKGYLILADDITEKRISESQTNQHEKLQSIGQLAAGIAHEINTPIQYVGDNTHFLEDAFKDVNQFVNCIKELVEKHGNSDTMDKFMALYEECDYDYLSEDIPKAIEQSLEGIGRVTSIVKAMKDFSHPGSDTKEPLDINRAIESTASVTRNVWKYVADLEMNLDPNVGEVYCFGGHFNEVVLNIMVNAAHAIESKHKEGEMGKITLSTKRFPKYVEIQIEDTGGGIPKHIQSKIFNPFFTTKEVGKGTGQGLSICHSIIVEQHEGELFFISKEGKGTTFYIRLPSQEVSEEE